MTTAALTSRIAHELAGIAGETFVCQDPAELEKLSVDNAPPGIAVSPGSAEEVAEVLRLANREGLVVVPAGGGTQQGIGRPPQKIDIMLRTSRLDDIGHYDPGDLTIGVGAGTTVSSLRSLAADHRQLFPLDIARADIATIGGTMATAAHSAERQSYGAIRDFCIGVKFVTGDGKIAKGGGRVVKNVAGFDLMKLMIGSFGTLGVIVSASFKVFPAPALTRTFVGVFDNHEGAIAFREAVLQSPLSPLCLELVSPKAQVHLGENAVSGRWSVLVRAGGSERVHARYRNELGSRIARELEGAEEARTWRAVAEFPTSVARQDGVSVVLNVSLTTHSIGEMLVAAQRAAEKNGLVVAVIGRVGVGSMLVAFLSPSAADCSSFANAITDFRDQLPRDASAFVLHCPTNFKSKLDVWGTSPTDIAAMRIVKNALDPNGILNRGRFLF
ncbi:MAG TPA: FAD-binding oxidoreductase [Terriglobales bacterium]|nr:FAD-binding oxidoreductase [Terriglobales bacterium]